MKQRSVASTRAFVWIIIGLVLVLTYLSEAVKISVKEYETARLHKAGEKPDDPRSFYSLLMEADISGKLWFGQNMTVRFAIKDVISAERVQDNSKTEFYDFQKLAKVNRDTSEEDMFNRGLKSVKYDVPLEGALVYKNKEESKYVQIYGVQRVDVSELEYHLKIKFIPSEVFSVENLSNKKSSEVEKLEESDTSSVTFLKRVDDESSKNAPIVSAWPKENITEPWELHMMFYKISNCSNGRMAFARFESDCSDSFLSTSLWIQSSFKCPQDISEDGKYKNCTFIWASSGQSNWERNFARVWTAGANKGFKCSESLRPVLPNVSEGVKFENLRLVVNQKLEKKEFPPEEDFEVCYNDDHPRSCIYVLCADLIPDMLWLMVVYAMFIILVLLLIITIFYYIELILYRRRREVYRIVPDDSELWGLRTNSGAKPATTEAA
ncbi:hypothetical protein Ddc_14272 [Ditylenchus destructor]|nr:hypothetical protein Ddc_14272 [Ditylenchus destructor]